MLPTGSLKHQTAVKLSPEDAKELGRMVTLLWGDSANYSTVFSRWSQGFTFSDEEPSALVQNAGGEQTSISITQIIKRLKFQVHVVLLQLFKLTC